MRELLRLVGKFPLTNTTQEMMPPLSENQRRGNLRKMQETEPLVMLVGH